MARGKQACRDGVMSLMVWCSDVGTWEIDQQRLPTAEAVTLSKSQSQRKVNERSGIVISMSLFRIS